MASTKTEDGIIDVRSEDEFEKGHEEGSTNISIDLLQSLLCALPPRDSQQTIKLSIVSSSEQALSQAITLVTQAGYEISRKIIVSSSSETLHSHSPSRRLWKPNTFLSRFSSIIEQQLADSKLPKTCLDIGCGSGRDSVFLCHRNWKVFGLDNNSKLLSSAQLLCKHEHCPNNSLITIECDVTKALPELIPPSMPVSLVHIARFLHRPLFASGQLQNMICPGGFILFHTFCEPSSGKPRGEKHLLKQNELLNAFSNFTVLHFGEERLGDGRPVQFILARKPFQ